MNLPWVQIGSFLMFLGVALGAFGAHMLRDKLSAHYLDVYKTGVLYHFIHGLAIFIVAWLCSQQNSNQLQWAGICFLLGIILFSGSLYILSTTGIKQFGMITPLGGVSFLIGWALLFFGAKGL